MKVCFIFDTVLLKKDDNFYGLTLNYDFFKNRYLDKMDSIKVVTRCNSFDSEKGNKDGYKITNGNGVIVSPIYSYKKITDRFFKYKNIYKEMEHSIKECDKVIIRMPSVLGLFACDICEKNKIPYMIEMVACAWDGYYNHTNKIGKIIAPYMFFSTKSRVKKCNNILYVTNNFLQKRYPTKYKQYECSDVELNELYNEDLKNKKNNYKNLDLKNYTMCTVANVGMRYKGHIYAFKAIKLLKRKGISIKYFLAGNGNQSYLKKYIKKLNIEENVVFLGALDHNAVFKLLEKIDIYIQPSLQEGLPRALVEAMSKACVCIGSDVGGIPELLSQKFIFKRKKYKELYNILYNLTNDDLIFDSESNFNKAKEFSKDSLDKKRNNIYLGFMQN